MQFLNVAEINNITLFSFHLFLDDIFIASDTIFIIMLFSLKMNLSITKNQLNNIIGDMLISTK